MYVPCCRALAASAWNAAPFGVLAGLRLTESPVPIDVIASESRTTSGRLRGGTVDESGEGLDVGRRRRRPAAAASRPSRSGPAAAAEGRRP